MRRREPVGTIRMSVYTLQKLLRDVNRIPERRAAYFGSPAKFAEGYDLTERERAALIDFDIRALYDMGVHGLILRPFTILHKVSDPEYVKALRGE
jgi:aromatic-ring opening dioxygenase LigAB LigA subunit